jgi:CheY-like chemotaxis protein
VLSHIGVEATSQIRRFDPKTPIISMTSNTSTQDCITYYSNGMNDILPKPINKTVLFDLLDKYCMHLKAMPGFQEVSRTLGMVERTPQRMGSGDDSGATMGESWTPQIAVSMTMQNEGEEFNHTTQFPISSEDYMQMFGFMSLSNSSTPGVVRYIDEVYGEDGVANDRQQKRPKFELLE